MEKSDFPDTESVKKMQHILPGRSILQRIAVPILLIVFVQLAFITTLKAQGWTFTFQLATSGPCGADLPYIQPFTPPMGLPTLSECNSIRQMILSISVSESMFDSHGRYLGECRVFYTCTECKGSDIVNPTSSSAPGSASVNGLTQGTAFFSPHESEALQRWLDDYLQEMNLMARPGTTPSTMNLKDVPLTRDNDFNKYYIDQTLRFEKPEQGGVVDFTTKSIIPKGPVVIPGSNTDYENQVENQYHVKLESVVPPLPDAADVPELHDNVDRNIEKGRDWTVAILGALPENLSEFSIPLIVIADIYAVGATAVNDCCIRIPPNCPTEGAILSRIYMNTAQDVTEAFAGNVINKIAPAKNPMGKWSVANILSLSEFGGDRLINTFKKEEEDTKW